MSEDASLLFGLKHKTPRRQKPAGSFVNPIRGGAPLPGPYVEMGGIEPPSDVVLSGLLRAQFASDFLGPSHAANSWLIRAQSSKSPVYPDDGGKQQWLSK